MNEQSVPRWRQMQQGAYLIVLLTLLLALPLLQSCATPSPAVIQPRLPPLPESLSKPLPPLPQIPTSERSPAGASK